MARYRVMIDDNFHYMDESERTTLGTFDTAAEAIEACEKIVNDSLRHHFKPGMSAAELMSQYESFGDDPFIVADDSEKIDFHAHDYAQRRSEDIAGAR